MSPIVIQIIRELGPIVAKELLELFRHHNVANDLDEIEAEALTCLALDKAVLAHKEAIERKIANAPRG